MYGAAVSACRGERHEAHLAIERFLQASRQPILFEPGEPSLPLKTGNFALTEHNGLLTLEAWGETRNLVRRVTGVAKDTRGRLELSVERFGKRAGTLLLADAAAPKNQSLDRRGARLEFRELFRRFLFRQFPGHRLQELSADPDLEHSLSPAYPRAFLRKGFSGWAAIGAAAGAGDISGIVSFGLIWLDYLRRREPRVAIEGLAFFLPAGEERNTCLRLEWLNPALARYAVFTYTEDGFEQPADLRDSGNLATHLEAFRRPLTAVPPDVVESVEHLCGLPGVDRVDAADGSVTLRVHGLPFARTEGPKLLSGLDRLTSGRGMTELERLVEELGRLRSPETACRTHPLFTRHPESWLESQVRANIEQLDASLYPEPIYGQVPAIAGVERGLLDLLACDRTGRLAVIELKASEDIHLPLQGLDYWMRVKWHLDRAEFGPRGYFPGLSLRPEPPRMLLVAPALEFHPTNETILKYFSSQVEVELLGIGIEWQRELKVMFRRAGREVPSCRSTFLPRFGRPSPT